MHIAALTHRSMQIVNDLLAGNHRIFAFDDRPPGFVQLERAGLVERCGTESARLTAAGKEKFGQPAREWTEPKVG